MPVSAFFAVTRASGTPAPEGSFTCPTIVLVIVWPQPRLLTIMLNSASLDLVLPHNKTLQFMCRSPQRNDLTRAPHCAGGSGCYERNYQQGPSLSMAPTTLSGRFTSQTVS